MSGFFAAALQEIAATPPIEDLPSMVWLQIADANGRSTYSLVIPRKQVSRGRDVWIQINDGTARTTYEVSATQPVLEPEGNEARYLSVIAATPVMQPRLTALSLVQRDALLRKSAAEIHAEANALYLTDRPGFTAMLEYARLRNRDP